MFIPITTKLIFLHQILGLLNLRKYTTFVCEYYNGLHVKVYILLTIFQNIW